MGIVRFALKFPHTFFVLAALILVLGVSAIVSMPTDIFPEINIPVVTVIWQYTGLSTPEMEQRVTTYSQYSISANVNGIKDIEAQTLNGVSVQKLYFQPDVDIDLAISQVVAATNAIRALMPTGIQPPIVVRYDASSVPVLQISLSSDTLNGAQLYDYGIYRMRQQLAPIHGITLPTPAGGKYRQIMVDIDPLKLQAKGLTPTDVVNAVNAQAFTVPAGTSKMGDKQYTVRTNALPATIDDLNNIPIKFVSGGQVGQTVFIKDIGQVHDGWLVQQNVVRSEGKQSVLLSIIKNGNASTLAVVSAVKEALKIARAAAPKGMQIQALFDQSVFVKDSIIGLLREGAIAAGLTALMIILFLGSWRSTLIVMVSIPLVDSLVARRPQFPRRDDQYDDPWRPGAGDRHPRRRLDGDDRKYPSLPVRREDAAASGDAPWLGKHCSPDARLDAGDQLRLHLGRVPHRAGEIPVHADGPCGGFRHARVLRDFPDADAHFDRLSLEGRAVMAKRTLRAARSHASMRRLTAGSSVFARATPIWSRDWWGADSSCRRRRY